MLAQIWVCKQNSKQPVHPSQAQPFRLVLYMHALVLYTSKATHSTCLVAGQQAHVLVLIAASDAGACQLKALQPKASAVTLRLFLPADIASHAPECERPAAGSSS